MSSPCVDCCVTNEQQWLRADELEVDAAKSEIDNENDDVEKGLVTHRNSTTTNGTGAKIIGDMVLFQGRIEPSDVMQGALGDCWLLAALATVAENNDDLLKTIFLTQSASECGYYKLRLYDVFNGPPSWKIFTVDDWIPVNNNSRVSVNVNVNV